MDRNYYYRRIFKQILDITVSLTSIMVLSPLLLFLIIVLKFANQGAGVFFTQQRPGKDEKIFKLIKFKTMTDERDETGKLLPDAKRLTRTGKIIRSLSIDELPQLINVARGDMSLVGPRPLLVHYLPLYSREQARRHEVRPGITGWAQVQGRNSVDWDKRFELDVWYVDHVSLWLDIKILWLTVLKVFKRDGINATGAATMKPFKGNKI